MKVSKDDKRRKIIGRTSATERDPNTADKFSFWVKGGEIVNPFDIVEVEHFNNSRTIGLVTGLEYHTDAFNHLANYLSNDYGSVEEEPNTPRVGVTTAKITVMMNDGGGKNEDGTQKDGIYMPVENEKNVYFSKEKGINLALGINIIEEKDRIPAGLIKMSNEDEAVVYLDSRYLLGPESAHLNISGITGLATKTSYAMFILQSLLQTIDPKKIAVIILNLKHGDLLQIDKPPDKLDESQKALWRKLGVEPKPFENVCYFLPRCKDGEPNSHIIPLKDYKKFAYSLDDSVDKLDILFSGVPDKADTIDSIVGEISNGFRTNKFSSVNNWDSLLNSPPLANDNGKSQGIGDIKPASVGKFRRHLHRMVQTQTTGIFTNHRTNDEYHLSEEIRGIEGRQTYVIDIAKLRNYEQSFVFGDIIRTIYKMFAESDETDGLPQKVIIFVDELNKYAPSGAKESPLIEQILDISERGRSLGVILFSAEQFMSAVHPRVTGNCATKVFGRTSSSEVMLPDYRFLDQELKLSLTRLTKGELLLQHAIFRQPVKIIFPKPAYKQD